VITFPLESLDANDPMAGLKRAKRISSHTAFFKVGVCLGRVLVCIVKCSPLSSTIKTLEPIDQSVRGRNKPTFRALLQGGNDTLKPFRVRTTHHVSRLWFPDTRTVLGILYSRGIEFDTFPQDEAVCGVPEGV
jgi:hypothetical protein